VVGLRVFEDSAGKMNLDVRDVGGRLLVVSQFTLYGDCRKGRRPSFVNAAKPEQASALMDLFVEKARAAGVECQTGRFRTTMDVSLVNHGPVTILIDSEKQF
jgi:D-tyrosyl-tRNA(Tyr) deacylase